MTPNLFKLLLNFWPPYIGTGIWVKEISKDYKHIKVIMKLRFWNKNYVGVHFGGSLYAMTDPFYMLMLMKILGKDYIVWDKAANIKFIKPGKGKVSAEFTLTESQIKDIKEKTLKNYKYEPIYTVLVKDTNGEVISEVEKTLYIRRKDKK